ncbi:MAG TPA: hypothetical protein PLG90_00600 [Ignavibacteria bacterium]|nr:hypothetical protein [Ignavibacteria bacterium]
MTQDLKTAKTFFLISAILHICYFFGIGTSLLFSGVIAGIFSCGTGCFVVIIPIINIVACVMDFIAYNKLNTLNAPDTYKTMYNAAIFDIISIVTGNIISLVFGILILQNLKKEENIAFLKDKGIY